MLRKYFNSKVRVIDLNNETLADTFENVIVQTERLADNLILVENVERDALCDLIPFGTISNPPKQAMNVVDDDLIYEYRETIINNDPFGKYSGEKLGKIFDNNDESWVKNALKSMRNVYIKDRVKYLSNYYKLGV